MSQSQDVLTLGLVQQLSRLGETDRPPLAQRLTQREVLLRLVDPSGLGGFCWLLFRRGCPTPLPGDLLVLAEPFESWREQSSQGHGCSAN